ncbi:MAG: DUF4145 domain-containing protein [Methanobacteriota archaeon]
MTAQKKPEKQEDDGLVGGLISGGLGAIGGGLIGYSKGKADGYSEGFRDGHTQGYNKAVADYSQKTNKRLKTLVDIHVVKYQKQQDGSLKPMVNINSTTPVEVFETIKEACNDYILGMERSCCIMAGVSVELALTIKYTNMAGQAPSSKFDFCALITWASKNNLINKQNTHVANTIRVMENLYKHDYKDYQKVDSIAMLTGSIRIIEKLF